MLMNIEITEEGVESVLALGVVVRKAPIPKIRRRVTPQTMAILMK